MNRIKQSIKLQVWLLFGIIFVLNLTSVGVLLSGWRNNTACVEDIEGHVASSGEIASITAAHVDWVNQLSEHLTNGKEFTGSLDPETCSFGQWEGALSQEFREDTAIAQALQQCRGNVSQAAKQLGISRQTLYRRLKAAQAGHSPGAMT